MHVESAPFIAPPCEDDIEILYQDEHLLLINKPSKLLSLSGKHPLNIDSVHHRLVKDFPTALMIHRLDLGTSGIMLIALNKVINKDLCEQFSSRAIKKSYTAVLQGNVIGAKGTIDLPIAKGEFPLQKICYEYGKPATSDYEVVERLPDRTRVTFSPITGRTHQLRIHSREIGHPILGCDLYGSDTSLEMSKRLMLHATTLEFVHPISQQKIVAQCECPF